MADRAYVVTGAVIISDDGNAQVKYHPQCPKCGTVMQETTCSGHVGQGIRANLGYCSCNRCGKSFPVQINRGC